jgi:hypothetical protein
LICPSLKDLISNNKAVWSSITTPVSIQIFKENVC